MRVKKCSKCLKAKSFEDCFSKNAATKDGKQYWCDDCLVEYQTTRYRKSPLLRAKRKQATKEWLNNKPGYLLKYKTGVTIEEYNNLFERQGGVCICCSCEERRVKVTTGERFRLAVMKFPTVVYLVCNRCMRRRRYVQLDGYVMPTKDEVML